MRTLVVLAVMGVCSASYQANNNDYGYPTANVQPRWTGPVAATIPAGVGGNVVPVSNTSEVSAARNAFFRAYNDQVDRISSLRYGTTNYGGPYGSGNSVQAPSAPTNSYNAPAPTYNAPAPLPTYSAPAPSYSAPAPVGPAYRDPTYPYGGLNEPLPVRDTPEVAAAKVEFFRTYERQAAEAAAAPDDYVSHNNIY